jgi:hypothetical protein
MPRKLARGWSWPLRPSEVEEVVPGFGHVTWSSPRGPGGDGHPTEEGWLLAAHWWARPGAMPPLRLTVYAVPSSLRRPLREAIVESVAPSVVRWRADADRSEGWRMLDHHEGWLWSADGSVRRVAGWGGRSAGSR